LLIKSLGIKKKEALPYIEVLYCMKISVFRGRAQKNREIKIPQKIYFELNREIKNAPKNLKFIFSQNDKLK